MKRDLIHGWQNYNKTCLLSGGDCGGLNAAIRSIFYRAKNKYNMEVFGIRDGTDVWVEGAEGAKVLVKAMITNRVGTGVAFMPFHFGGHFQGKDLRSKYPKGADPIVLGESSNTAQTYGYDSVTQMQETKATLCKIMPA